MSEESDDKSDSEGALLSELGDAIGSNKHTNLADNNNNNNYTNLADNNNTNDGLDESEEAVIQVQQRNRWCQLQKFYKHNGKTVVTYPFLMDPNNLKDELLIAQLIIDEPFAAKYGEVKAAWENVASKLKEQKSGGEYIYHRSLCSKTIRDRFTKYVEVVKSYDRDVPLRSGDDSEVFYERFGELEKLCSRYLSAASEIDDAKKDSLQKKKIDREAAEAIKKASLGKITAARTRSDTLSDSDSDDSFKYSDQSNDKISSTKKKQKKKKAKQSDTAKIGNNVAMFSLIVDEREDRKKQKESRLRLKEENRSKALELQQQSLQLQQQRLDAYLKQQEEQAKQQDAQRELMLALAKSFTK
jgi:hypothetical protein